MEKALPEARFTFPAVTERPLAKVEEAAPETVRRFDTVMMEVDACCVATKEVVVALVLVEFVEERSWRVEEDCAIKPELPVRKMLPKPPAMEPEARAPTVVKEEVRTPVPKVVPFNT